MIRRPPRSTLFPYTTLSDLGARRQRPGLSDRDRDPGDADAGEEGHAPALRRGADRGAGGSLREPEQLREGLRPERRAPVSERAQWGDLGQPVRQRCEPRRTHYDHRPRDLGPTSEENT